MGAIALKSTLKRLVSSRGEFSFVDLADVFIQDQTTPPLQIPFMQANTPSITTLSAAIAIGDRVFSVVDGTIFTADDRIVLISAVGRFYIGRVLSIATNDLTVDTPADYAYQIGDEAISLSDDLDVDGSITPQIFSLRGDAGTIDVPVCLDITRILGYMLTSGVPDLAKFGDITAGLTNGMVLRRNNGTVDNIHNVKSNGDIVSLAFDFTPYAASIPGLGVNGIGWRMTFAGQAKHGVAIRLEPDESLEYIVQDDLTDLLTFHVFGEGHIVED